MHQNTVYRFHIWVELEPKCRKIIRQILSEKFRKLRKLNFVFILTCMIHDI